MPNVRTAFQRRHYQAIAEILATALSDQQGNRDLFVTALVERITGQFADMFAADNPRFSRQRFVDAAQGR